MQQVTNFEYLANLGEHSFELSIFAMHTLFLAII
jgi:hypothetical protein